MATQKLLYRIKGCGCDCADLPASPCEPCEGGQFEIQWATRAATALLVGFSEFTTPSVPPIKYLKCTGSGTLNRDFYNTSSPGCGPSNFIGAGADVGSGQSVYSATTGVKTSGIYVTTTGPVAGVAGPSDSTLGILGSLLDVVDTRTTHTGTPHPDACFGSFPAFIATGGSLIDTLSQPDTEANAIGRSSAAWSAWKTEKEGGVMGCSRIDTRGAGQFSFGFSDGKFRIRTRGTVGAVVTVELVFGRRDADSVGAFTQIFTDIRQYVVEQASWAPAESNLGWAEGSVPLAYGKETCLLDAHRYQP